MKQTVHDRGQVIETTRNGMPANFLTVITFVLTNGPIENADGPIWLSGFVETSSGDEVDPRWSASPMTPRRMATDNAAVLGILNGSNPLKFLRPYLVKNISQGSAQVSALNTLTVTLQLNIQLHSAQGSQITLSGLPQTATPSTQSLALTYPNGNVAVFGNTGSWTQSSGTLVLAVSNAGTGSLEARQMYVFSFQLANPSVGQAAAAVTIAGIREHVCVLCVLCSHDCAPAQGESCVRVCVSEAVFDVSAM